MQNFLVLGMGQSGISACELLLAHGKKVAIFDNEKSHCAELKAAKLVAGSVEIRTKLNKAVLNSVDAIVLSPGFVLPKNFEKLTQKNHIPIFSELDFASTFCAAPIYAISGTNGKTTTATMLHQIFESAGKLSHLLGNVGVPFSSAVDTLTPNSRVVLEVSSFQLEHCDNLRCRAVALLNVANDHLDRYASFREYYYTKRHLLDCVAEGGDILLNFDDNLVRILGKNRPNVRYFSLHKLSRELDGFYLDSGAIWSQRGGKAHTIAILDDVEFVGEHNYANLVCAVGLAYLARVPAVKIQAAISQIKLPRHRIEFAGEKGGVRFYDDSKATNIHSTLSAIKSFDAPINLMLGGSDKGEDFGDFLANLPAKVVQIVAFGAMGKKIYAKCRRCGVKAAHFAPNLMAAFDYIKAVATRGSVVLLSPACASFDEFSGYAERGDAFCNLVAEWVGED